MMEKGKFVAMLYVFGAFTALATSVDAAENFPVNEVIQNSSTQHSLVEPGGSNFNGATDATFSLPAR